MRQISLPCPLNVSSQDWQEKFRKTTLRRGGEHFRLGCEVSQLNLTRTVDQDDRVKCSRPVCPGLSESKPHFPHFLFDHCFVYTLFECFLIFIFEPACLNELKTEPADMFLPAAVANFGQCAIVE